MIIIIIILVLVLVLMLIAMAVDIAVIILVHHWQHQPQQQQPLSQPWLSCQAASGLRKSASAAHTLVCEDKRAFWFTSESASFWGSCVLDTDMWSALGCGTHSILGPLWHEC